MNSSMAAPSEWGPGSWWLSPRPDRRPQCGSLSLTMRSPAVSCPVRDRTRTPLVAPGRTRDRVRGAARPGGSGVLVRSRTYSGGAGSGSIGVGIGGSGLGSTGVIGSGGSGSGCGKGVGNVIQTNATMRSSTMPTFSMHWLVTHVTVETGRSGESVSVAGCPSGVLRRPLPAEGCKASTTTPGLRIVNVRGRRPVRPTAPHWTRFPATCPPRSGREVTARTIPTPGRCGSALDGCRQQAHSCLQGRNCCAAV